MNTVLVCAAHPDDEVLGCGGTMSRHAADGDTVHVIFVADGVSSRTPYDKEDILRRYESARQAAKMLGAEVPFFCDLPDQRLDTLPLLRITEFIEGLASGFMPNIVYTHHTGDLNLDHRIVAQAVLTAFRPLPRSSVNAIYGFETLSSTEWGSCFAPQRYVAIELPGKMLTLKASYDYEMRPFPHARSYEAVKALADLRGATVGVAAAEAFTVLREIVR